MFTVLYFCCWNTVDCTYIPSAEQFKHLAQVQNPGPQANELKPLLSYSDRPKWISSSPRVVLHVTSRANVITGLNAQKMKLSTRQPTDVGPHWTHSFYCMYCKQYMFSGCFSNYGVRKWGPHRQWRALPAFLRNIMPLPSGSLNDSGCCWNNPHYLGASPNSIFARLEVSQGFLCKWNILSYQLL